MFYLKERAKEDTSSYDFVPIIAVVAYIIVYCLGKKFSLQQKTFR